LIVYGEFDSINTLLGNKINGKMYNAIFNVYSGIKSRIVHTGKFFQLFSL
jgi:hypothetical protein